MSVLTLTAGAQAIYRVNPVAKLAAAAILGIALVVSLDWVSAAVALGCELLLLPFAGLTPKRLLLRTWPVLVAAPLSALTILLYGSASGESYLRFLFIDVTDGSIALAIATGLRVLAIGIPAVVLFVTVDPTDLADGLAQTLKLPARFVIGALGGMRLVTLFAADWRSLELSRRARGLGDHGRLRRFASQAFSLLVLSIRRGSKLATAMEARGFGAPTTRTWARESRFGGPEALLIVIGVLIAAVAIAASVGSGEWNPLGSA